MGAEKAQVAPRHGGVSSETPLLLVLLKERKPFNKMTRHTEGLTAQVDVGVAIGSCQPIGLGVSGLLSSVEGLQGKSNFKVNATTHLKGTFRTNSHQASVTGNSIQRADNFCDAC